MADDIVNRLLPFIHDEMRMPAGLIKDVIEEIERLRTAGDALAICLRSGSDSGWDDAIDAWEEAHSG